MSGPANGTGSPRREHMKPELTRRKILGGVASLGILGAGVTAQTGLNGASISGSADVQAEQALTINSVAIPNANGDTDASFTRVSDDNTEYQVAAELKNGDSFQVRHAIENNSDSRLPVQFTVECSDDLTVDLEADDESNEPVKSGDNTFVVDFPDGTTNGYDLDIDLTDTADPGAYDVSVAINPLSGGESDA